MAEALLAVEVIGALEAGSAAAVALGAAEAATVVGGTLAAAEGFGAAAGTLEAANAVGALGGDSLGAFIAGNAENWGVSAAGLGAESTVLGSALNSKVGQAVAGNVASSVISSTLGKTAVPAARGTAPAVPAPLVMPLPDDQAVTAARRRSIAAQQQRMGRASTILSEQSQRLGN